MRLEHFTPRMDITSKSTPMQKNENNNQQPKREKSKADIELQAQMFFFLRKRLELNDKFNPTININTQNKSNYEKEVQKNNEEKEIANIAKFFVGIKKQKEQSQSDATKALSKENKIYVTELWAIDPIDHILKSWSGPDIIAKNEEEAQGLIQNTGLGYCQIIGELQGLIDTKGNDVKNAYRDN